MAEESQIPVFFEDLALIEDEFEEIDNEIIRQQYNLSKPLYTKRSEILAKIPHFWALVMEQAPVEVDQFIHPHDSKIFAESLVNLSVTRPELETADGAKGSPRSLHIRFEFKPNDFFSDTVLEKTLWYRRAKDGWTGLVSEPVKVNWKKDKDLTEGLTDGAVALWEARKKIGDMRAEGLPEYTALKKKVESWNAINTSFFTWFGWVSDRRWVSKEESEAAVAAHQQHKEARKRGEKDEDKEDEDEDEDDDDDSAVEVHEAGDELAISLADDIWPNAIKWFTQASELEELSDVDFEEDDEMDEDEDDEAETVDIRALVGEGAAAGRAKRQSDGGPPSKKAKK